MNDSPRIELVRLTWKMSDSLDAGGKPAAISRIALPLPVKARGDVFPGAALWVTRPKPWPAILAHWALLFRIPVPPAR